jgi:hypothetical protein
VVPGTYTIRLTRGSDVVETKLPIGVDRRAPYTVASKQQQFKVAMRAQGLFEDMSKLVDQIQQLREAVDDRAKGIPANDALTKQLHELADKLDAARTLIVATKEGGAITGEERIREHLDTVYGAINGWEGKPTQYQVANVDALAKELADVHATFKSLATKDARALDEALKQHKREPLPTISQLGTPAQALDEVALECLDSHGEHCENEAERAAERD